jgi:hypothetical protein
MYVSYVKIMVIAVRTLECFEDMVGKTDYSNRYLERE